MRPVLAILLALLTSLAAATDGSPQAAPRISVSVTASAPTAPGGGRIPRGLRAYAVSFRVKVTADQQCENLSVTYSYVALFNGRRSLAGSATDFYDTSRPASSAMFTVHAQAGAADVVSFSARGACEQADGSVLGTSRRVAATVRVPAHSCEEGPLRALAVSGSVARQDLQARGLRVPVRRGHHLWTGYRVWLGKRSRIAVGAPECNGLRALVTGPVSIIPGDYSRGSSGTSTQLGFGGAVDFRGDQHSGGVETDNAIALPRGKRTGPSKAARFQIVSFPKNLGRITRVRVKRGEVYVAGRTGPAKYSAPVIVRAGQTSVVRCAPTRACKPTAPKT
jgi:hypothetical protein